MLNQVSIVGKVIDTYSLENGFYVVLSVKRCFKEVDGSILSDNVKCRIWKSLLKDVKRQYKNGMYLSIAGRINCIDDNFYIDCYDVSYLGMK